MQSKIRNITFLIISVFVIVVLDVYSGPILATQNDNFFEDNFSGDLLAAARSSRRVKKSPTPTPTTQAPAPAPAPVPTTSYSESFDTNYSVKETGNMSDSPNPNWWVSSGAYMYSEGGIGRTILGNLSAVDPWRVAFLLSNPLDTDNGYHPQNIFRFVLTKKFKNFSQEAYFKILADNLSTSPNRNASNGLFFFNRYQDAFNLYYTGIRVDGYAVIKKKTESNYYTMAYKPLYSGTYNTTSNPNLLPKDSWIGMKSEVITNTDGTVTVRVYVDKNKSGTWTLAAEAKDDGKAYGGSVIGSDGYAGIRTDFMDVQFDDYKITSK